MIRREQVEEGLSAPVRIETIDPGSVRCRACGGDLVESSGCSVCGDRLEEETLEEIKRCAPLPRDSWWHCEGCRNEQQMDRPVYGVYLCHICLVERSERPDLAHHLQAKVYVMEARLAAGKRDYGRLLKRHQEMRGFLTGVASLMASLATDPGQWIVSEELVRQVTAFTPIPNPKPHWTAEAILRREG